MKRSGAGWKKQGAKAAYIAIELDLGVLGSVKAMMFANTKKTEPFHPDYTIMIADDDGKPQAKPRPQPSKQIPITKQPTGMPREVSSQTDEAPWPEQEF